MRHRLAKFLRQWNLADQYETNQKVGDEDFHVIIPFVHRFEATIERAIKPLDLDKQDTSDIYHHGGAWVKNMERLAKRSRMPKTTVFSVRMPAEGKRLKAAEDICDELRLIGIQAVPFGETSKLRELAEVSKAS